MDATTFSQGRTQTMNDTREYGHGTSLTVRMPWGLNVAARALCPDGVVRAVKRIAETADTFFSVPASVEVRRNGKRFTVAGYVTTETVEGWSTASDADPIVVKFVPYTNRKNDQAFGRMFRELSACVDCYTGAANGTDDMDDATAARVKRAARDRGHLSTGDDLNEFSAMPCEVCGSTLAGSRHQVFEDVTSKAVK